MELPAALRHAVDQALQGVPLSDLATAADRLSQRYRAEIRDGRQHLDNELAALAYLTTRLPATYAAVRAALSMVAERVPDFQPARQLDLGAGPGTAFWAALDCWPDLTAAHLLEGSGAIRRQGELLIARALSPASDEFTGDGFTGDEFTGDRFTVDESTGGDAPATPQNTPHVIPRVTWAEADLARPDQHGTADLVTLCYVLDELSPEARHRLIDWSWASCTGLLLIVEPGTSAGWRRILAARDQLLANHARIIAPCPHDLPCPLLAGAGDGMARESWCHFSRRVARSRLHRLAKQADVPWEDEKFIFIAVARPHIAPAGPPIARIIGSVRGGSGRLNLPLCESDGQARSRLITKRDGELYRRARRLDWGDCLVSAEDARE